MAFLNHSINKEFEYRNYILGELKEQIMKQSNLEYSDIIKGYHEKNRVNVDYESVKEPLSEDIRADIASILKDLEGEYVIRMAKEYSARYSAFLDKYAKIFEEDSDFVRKWTSFENYLTVNTPQSKTWNYSPAISKNAEAIKGFCRSIEEFYKEEYSKMYDHFCDLVAEKYPSVYILKRFDNTYKTLPHSINFSIDFKSGICFNQILDSNAEIISLIEEDGYNRRVQIPIPSGTEIHGFYYSNTCSSVSVSKDIELRQILSEEEALTVFEKGIASLIQKFASAEWSHERYLYEIDNSPITININSKTGHIELLDGYKRLMFNMDKECMSLNTPIRVFTDLSDEEFLALLLQFNYWKTTVRDIPVFDRGFLFALKEHFGFEIPSYFFDKYNNTYAFKILENYDFGCHLPDSGISGDTRGKSFIESFKKRTQYVNDIKILYSDEVHSVLDANHGYDIECYNHMIFEEIPKVLGMLRRLDKVQLPLTVEIIKDIFTDSFIVSLCKKKIYSTDTYTSNMFCDKGVYKRIQTIIYERCCQ